MILLLLSLAGFKDKDKYVNSIDDFKVHTQNHIQNVYKLGMALYNENKDTLYKDIPEDLVREKLLLHDYEKLASLPELQVLGYHGNETFLEKLYVFFGKSKEIQTISELNLFARKFEEDFFRKNNLINENGRSHPIAEKLASIERIADIVDRQHNPITPEEFGRSRMRGMANFLITLQEIKLARKLARNYNKIVSPNPLIHRTTLTEQESLCIGLFD